MGNNEDFDLNMEGFGPDEPYYTPTARQRQTPASSPSAADTASRPESSQEKEPKKSPKQKELAPEQRTNAFVRFFTDDRLRIFLGAALLLSSLFILVAFVSHLKYGALDQSVVAGLSRQEAGQIMHQAQNAGGKFGAWLSQTFFCDALGMGSLAFIVYFCLLSLALWGFRKCNFWSITFKTLLVAITCSLVFGLIFFNTPSAFKWGGLHGYFINKFLIDNGNIILAIVVSLILVVAVVCVYLNELRNAWRKWKIRAYRHKMQKELKDERKKKVNDMGDPTFKEEEKPQEASSPNNSNSSSIPLINLDFSSVNDNDTKDRQSENNTTDENIITTQEPEPVEAKGSNDLDSILNDYNEDPNRSDNASAQPSFYPVTPTEASSNTQPVINNTSDNDSGFFIDLNGNDSPQQPSKEQAPKHFEDMPDESFEELPKENYGEVGTELEDIPQPQQPNEIKIDETFTINAPVIEQAMPIDNASNYRSNQNACLDPYDHKAELPKYRFPSIELLNDVKVKPVIDVDEQQANKQRIEKTLLDYKIPISKIEATVGPTVTLYEIVPAEGVRISQIKRLEDDIALSLSALGIRIIAPIPGKGTVGIEVPNRDPQTVSMRSVIASKEFQESKMALPMAMGATISNKIFIADLAKMPHLLVAGATGMGKSVGLNAILASLLYKKHPSELKLVLIDPKMVEFSLYSKLERHYLAKLPSEDDAIITDPSKVIMTLNSLCVEMDDRYDLLRKANVRSLEEYNKKFTERKLNPKDGHKYLPYIVMVVDEFADLIMTAGKDVETPIARIAQKARAVGMHMIIATQRPSTNVITGLIKANFPGRIAFRVSQMVDSRTILDTPGANQLIGRGDMLFSHNGVMERVQCAFISTEEVESITQCIDDQIGYEHPYYLPEVPSEQGDGFGQAGASSERDPLFDEAARFVVTRQVGSTSMLQRQFNIGYNRAGRLMDQMEAAGIVGPVNGAKPRNILMDIVTLESILG